MRMRMLVGRTKTENWLGRGWFPLLLVYVSYGSMKTVAYLPRLSLRSQLLRLSALRFLPTSTASSKKDCVESTTWSSSS